MPLKQLDFRQGIRITPPRLSLVAAATPLELYRPPNATAITTAPTVNTFTAILRKLHIFTNGPSTVVSLGVSVGAGFVSMMDFAVTIGIDNEFGEDQIPNFEWTSAVIAQAAAAGAAPGADVRLLAEFDVFTGGALPVNA